jgi:glutamate N-acetyltransferase / amino-acid N-acetyltransferase
MKSSNDNEKLLSDSAAQLPDDYFFFGYPGGLKKDRNDTALIYCERPCSWAGVFTRNSVKAHCVTRNESLLKKNQYIRAIAANSGNANACTGKEGAENNDRFAGAVASLLGCSPSEVLTASTGVIGVQLPMQKMEEQAAKVTMAEIKDKGHSKEKFISAAEAIMTTDTKRKCVSYSYNIGGTAITVSGIAKGSGMIHPNMGTMLSFICTDAVLPSSVLQSSLKIVIDDTFNMISVDGDTSTNDMVLLLAHAPEKEMSFQESEALEYISAFRKALMMVCRFLAVEIARDGEGASKLIRCRIEGASSIINARTIAKSVIGSSLVKCAFFGEDANWGRIVAAMGYSGADFNPNTVSIFFRNFEGSRSVALMGKGVPLPFSEEQASDLLAQDEIEIYISLEGGNASATAWGCDLSYDYVKINGDYRS